MVPSIVGTLPTITKPLRSTPRAVLSPPRGLVKNTLAVPGGARGPLGLSCTMVVPVPCRLAPLLKLLTSTSPAAMVPPPGKFSGTKATPYGLTSPLGGTVEELTGRGMKARSLSEAWASAAQSPRPAVKMNRAQVNPDTDVLYM